MVEGGLLALGIVTCMGGLLFLGAGCCLEGLGIICGAWGLFVGAGCYWWALFVGAGSFVGCGDLHVVHILLFCGIVVGCCVVGVIVGCVMCCRW